MFAVRYELNFFIFRRNSVLIRLLRYSSQNNGSRTKHFLSVRKIDIFFCMPKQY
jgi:hypothetical protein